jgi:hypothetical protein
MQPIPAGLLRSARTVPAAPRFSMTLILYVGEGEVSRASTDVADELMIARVEVKHLEAACRMLKTCPQAFLVASASISWWDREVLEEHAARAGTTVRWVSSGTEPYAVGDAVRKWALDAMKRARIKPPTRETFRDTKRSRLSAPASDVKLSKRSTLAADALCESERQIARNATG